MKKYRIEYAGNDVFKLAVIVEGRTIDEAILSANQKFEGIKGVTAEVVRIISIKELEA
jgi:hypothetical protein